MTDWGTRGLRETQDKLFIHLSGRVTGSTPKAACQARNGPRTSNEPGSRTRYGGPERYRAGPRRFNLEDIRLVHMGQVHESWQQPQTGPEPFTLI